MKIEQRLGIVAASLACPGFAQALTGRRVAMVIWAALGFVPVVLGVFSVWFPMAAILVRVGSGIGAWIHIYDLERAPTWRRLAPIAVAVLGLGGFVFLVSTVEGYKIPSSSMYPTVIIGDHVFVDKLTVRWRAPERGEVIVFTHPCSQHAFIKRVLAVGGDTIEVRCNIVYVNGKPLASALVAARDEYRDRDDGRDQWFSRSCSRYRETAGDHTYDVFHDAERPARDRDSLTGDARDFPQRDHMMAPSCQQGNFYDDKPGIKQPKGKLVETKARELAKPCEPQLHFVVPADSLFVMGDNRNNANDSRYWGAVSTSSVIGRVIGVWLSDGEEGSWDRIGAID